MNRIDGRIQMQLRIDKDLHAKLKLIAQQEHRFLNGQIEYYIALGVQEYEKQHGPIELPDHHNN